MRAILLKQNMFAISTRYVRVCVHAHMFSNVNVCSVIVCIHVCYAVLCKYGQTVWYNRTVRTVFLKRQRISVFW